MLFPIPLNLLAKDHMEKFILHWTKEIQIGKCKELRESFAHWQSEVAAQTYHSSILLMNKYYLV